MILINYLMSIAVTVAAGIFIPIATFLLSSIIYHTVAAPSALQRQWVKPALQLAVQPQHLPQHGPRSPLLQQNPRKPTSTSTAPPAIPLEPPPRAPQPQSSLLPVEEQAQNQHLRVALNATYGLPAGNEALLAHLHNANCHSRLTHTSPCLQPYPSMVSPGETRMYGVLAAAHEQRRRTAQDLSAFVQTHIYRFNLLRHLRRARVEHVAEPETTAPGPTLVTTRSNEAHLDALVHVLLETHQSTTRAQESATIRTPPPATHQPTAGGEITLVTYWLQADAPDAQQTVAPPDGVTPAAYWHACGTTLHLKPHLSPTRDPEPPSGTSVSLGLHPIFGEIGTRLTNNGWTLQNGQSQVRQSQPSAPLLWTRPTPATATVTWLQPKAATKVLPQAVAAAPLTSGISRGLLGRLSRPTTARSFPAFAVPMTPATSATTAEQARAAPAATNAFKKARSFSSFTGMSAFRLGGATTSTSALPGAQPSTLPFALCANVPTVIVTGDPDDMVIEQDPEDVNDMIEDDHDMDDSDMDDVDDSMDVSLACQSDSSGMELDESPLEQGFGQHQTGGFQRQPGGVQSQFGQQLFPTGNPFGALGTAIETCGNAFGSSGNTFGSMSNNFAQTTTTSFSNSPSGFGGFSGTSTFSTSTFDTHPPPPTNGVAQPSQPYQPCHTYHPQPTYQPWTQVARPTPPAWARPPSPRPFTRVNPYAASHPTAAHHAPQRAPPARVPTDTIGGTSLPRLPLIASQRPSLRSRGCAETDVGVERADGGAGCVEEEDDDDGEDEEEEEEDEEEEEEEDEHDEGEEEEEDDQDDEDADQDEESMDKDPPAAQATPQDPQALAARQAGARRAASHRVAVARQALLARRAQREALRCPS